MPQMAPLSWLLLFIVFSITFVMFNILNYYCFFSNMPKQTSTKTLETSSLNWKW